MQYDKTFTSTYLYNGQKDYKPTTMSGTLQNKCQIRHKFHAVCSHRFRCTRHTKLVYCCISSNRVCARSL